jgi:hypothetical protein
MMILVLQLNQCLFDIRQHRRRRRTNHYHNQIHHHQQQQDTQPMLRLLEQSKFEMFGIARLCLFLNYT